MRREQIDFTVMGIPGQIRIWHMWLMPRDDKVVFSRKRKKIMFWVELMYRIKMLKDISRN